MKINPEITKELFLELLEDLQDTACDYGQAMVQGIQAKIDRAASDYETATKKVHHIIDIMFK